MKKISFVILLSLAAVALAFIGYSPDIDRIKQDVQAYSHRSLLPETSGYGEDVGK